MASEKPAAPVIDWQNLELDTDEAAAELEAKIEALGQAAVRKALKAPAERAR